MRANFSQFDPNVFSFHADSVLILDNFWSQQERAHLQQAMRKQLWTGLRDMPEVSRAFPNCGNWQKAKMNQPEAAHFLDRIAIPCIADYVESFPSIKQRHVAFSYYNYGVGDCLSMHDDTDEQYAAAPSGSASRPTRRLALVTYLHDTWQHDWGGELMIYADNKAGKGQQRLELTHCIAPDPGRLVIFSVPRFHRVARVDPLAGAHERLSIAGWIMTEH